MSGNVGEGWISSGGDYRVCLDEVGGGEVKVGPIGEGLREMGETSGHDLGTGGRLAKDEMKFTEGESGHADEEGSGGGAIVRLEGLTLNRRGETLFWGVGDSLAGDAVRGGGVRSNEA